MSCADELYVRFALDLVIFTIRDDRLQVLVTHRAEPPASGELCLPTTALGPEEDLPEAAQRGIVEATGLDSPPRHLEQLASYRAPHGDPRGRVVSVAYLAIVPEAAAALGPDAPAAWRPVVSVRGELAFDGNRILDDAVERLQDKLEDTDLATVFCGETFTIGELRRVYEVVWEDSLDPRNFSRKVLGTTGLVVPTGQLRRQETGRPAVLYQRGTARKVIPPMLRAGAADN